MKSFYNGHPQDKRTISINVDKDHILFYFDNELRRFYQNAKQNDELGYEEEKDLAEPTYFYWLGVSDWIESPEHWSAHMGRKAWFTQEMQDYITQQIQKQK